jgi:hypothetical protein
MKSSDAISMTHEGVLHNNCNDAVLIGILNRLLVLLVRLCRHPKFLYGNQKKLTEVLYAKTNS